tara:strand:+ start:12 stop:314 length:303 start_codon:yes stop_codon:yes gene_type:complete
MKMVHFLDYGLMVKTVVSATNNQNAKVIQIAEISVVKVGNVLIAQNVKMTKIVEVKIRVVRMENVETVQPPLLPLLLLPLPPHQNQNAQKIVIVVRNFVV